MPRAKQRTPELRDRLLEVAIATLSEEGIARFTTRRVAERAGTSVHAVYELFHDKAGLVRAMFFEGFRLLGGELAKVPVTADPVADLERLVPVFRLFCRAYPRLAQVMFSRPFADFEPGPEELAAGASVREVFVGRGPYAPGRPATTPQRWRAEPLAALLLSQRHHRSGRASCIE